MKTFLHDLRFAFRVLRKRPLFTLTLLLILAVGIGANTAIFNLVNAMLIRPLPYTEPDRLVALHEAHKRKGTDWHAVSPLNLRDWTAESRSFSEVASYQRDNLNLNSTDQPERIEGARVTADLFPMLGIDPLLGRGFTAAEETAGNDRVALLGHDLWQRRFRRDPGVVGQTVRLDGDAYTVVGVMPPRFQFPEWAELWTPLAVEPADTDRGERSLEVLARLGPGAGVELAQSDLDAVAGRLEELYPRTNADWGARVRPLRLELMPQEARVGLLLLLGAVGFVLLIVCANVATLMLAQAAARRKENALRVALGASRWRMARQLLTESLLIGVLGGVVGVGLSIVGVKLMVGAVPVPIPFWIRFDLDARVLAFTLGVAVVTGLLFGLAPALQAARRTGLRALKEEGRGGSGGARQSRIRNMLVGAEFALSLVLLVGAMLMVKSFYKLQEVDRGFQPAGVLTSRLSLTGDAYETVVQRREFVDRMVSRVEALPGVRSAAVVSFLPLSREGYQPVQVIAEGGPVELGEAPSATLHGMSAGYLETIGVDLMRGRQPSRTEIGDGAPVAMISANLAERLWGDEAALGRRLRGLEGDGEWLTVVGITEPTRQNYQMAGVDAWPDSQLYAPYTRGDSSSLTLAVRTTGDPLALVDEVRGAGAAVDPGLPRFNGVSMPQVLERVEWLPRFWGQMFTAFAAIALFIAAVGVYGLTAYSVGQRTREIGIRMALGANGRDLLRWILGGSLKLALIGLACGLVVAFAVTRVMATLLYGVSATDPLVYGGVSLLLLAVAVAASYLPARRALAVDPQSALRST
jgi:putative ABC transport system permease protein